MAVVDNAAGITIDASGQHMNAKVLDGLPAASATGQAVRYDEAVVTAGTHAFTAVQSGVDPTAAAHLVTRAYADLKTIIIRSATTAALPAYTFTNAGAGGVGDTIVPTAHAAIPSSTLDNLSPSVGDEFFIFHTTAYTHQGVYVFTAVGDGATTDTVLTRSTRHDTSAKIMSTMVKANEGIAHRGALWEYINKTNPTINTDALGWMRIDEGCPPQYKSRQRDDFTECMNSTGSVATNINVIGTISPLVQISGTGTCLLQPTNPTGTATESGIIKLTATTSTAQAALCWAVAGAPMMITQDQYFEMTLCAFGPNALSDGTDTYRILYGLADALATSFTNGILLEYTQATSTNWLATARTSGVSATSAGPTVATNTKVTLKMWKNVGETNLNVSFNYGASASISTIPLNVAMTFICSITKSVGNTNLRSFSIDYFDMVQAWPKGRA